MVLIVRLQLSAGCHDRFFPGEVGRDFRRIRLSVFNRFPNSRERQVIISRKFLWRAWFLGIDMRPIQQFGANPRAFDEELAIEIHRQNFVGFLLQCAAELGHEWTIDHSSEARHNAALQETFVYRT